MSYLPIALNHFRAVKEWGDKNNAVINLDARSFNLEIKFQGRQIVFKPRFLMTQGEKMAYTTQLVKDVTGFIGWLPYDILSWDLSQNKLLAKRFFEIAGLKTPKYWASTSEVEDNFVVKGSAGSFGYQIAGPYRRGANVWATQSQQLPSSNRGSIFLEQFVFGSNLKVWFWGSEAIYAQVHSYPTIVGDGVTTIRDLIAARVMSVGIKPVNGSDQDNQHAALAFQQVQASDVLAQGRKVWLDFRYGRRYVQSSVEIDSDSDLDQIVAPVRKQIAALGKKVAEQAKLHFNTPVLCSVDGVIDEKGAVWWLEINSNPMLPPEGYDFMFSSLLV